MLYGMKEAVPLYRLAVIVNPWRTCTVRVTVVSPQCACIARVTVLGSVCVCVPVCVCVSVKSHLTYGASVCPENAFTYSAGNEGQENLWGFA